jgi:SAM-dependent methyltransferase
MTYSPSYFSARESWRDWRIEARQLIDRARVSKGTRVLEIGCGGGGLLRLLHERGAVAVGIDTLEIALELARGRDDPPGRLYDVIRIGEDGALPFRDAAFDAVIGQHVVEHLPDADAALREWNRVLAPGGRLALATPNAHYPDPAHFEDADHARVFSPRELDDAAASAGFAVEACYTIFPYLTRGRALRAVSVMGYRLFQHAPYFATRGRTIILSARKC